MVSRSGRLYGSKGLKILTPNPAAQEPFEDPPFDPHSLEVKQVPFRYWVDPLDKESVLWHGSFLKLTTVNKENTETQALRLF